MRELLERIVRTKTLTTGQKIRALAILLSCTPDGKVAVSQTEVGRRFGMDPAGISLAVRKLRSVGFLQHEKCVDRVNLDVRFADDPCFNSEGDSGE